MTAKPPAAANATRRPSRLRAAAGLALLAATGTAAAEDRVLGPYFSADGSCYARRYDAAHLARHPRQEVHAIWLGVTDASRADPVESVEAVLGFGFRIDDESYEAVVYCRRDACEVEGDGGSFKLAPKGDAVQLTVGTHLAIENATSFSPDLGASADDRVFLLRPASERSCG